MLVLEKQQCNSGPIRYRAAVFMKAMGGTAKTEGQ
jgi:hypothetical protein